MIIIFLITKNLRTPTNLFIVNLAFSDLCMMTTQALPVSINAFVEDVWMYGPLMCRVYACIGGIFGTSSLLMMVAIGYDRYNVIVKGISGFRISYGVALLIILTIWTYSTLVCIPPFLGWGGYALEGLMVTCSYDYLSTDWNHKSFMLYAFIGNFSIPVLTVICFYTSICKAVIMHEAALKAQAKKMNVDSLRSNANQGESAEVRIAKVAITNVCLWIFTWTPYATVVMIGCFGNRSLVSPLVSALPAFLAKTASCFNPIVFALSHPKYRQALQEKLPCLGIGEKSADGGTQMQAVKADA